MTESPPCAACRLQRKKCSKKCPLAPHFPGHEPDKFAMVHRVFGTGNVIRMLKVSCDVNGTPQLCWGDGYYKGPKNAKEDEKLRMCSHMTITPADQELRKKVLRDLHSMISGADETNQQDEDVTDAKWFYLVSMMQIFLLGFGVSGFSFSRGDHAWLVGAERLQTLNCDRAKQAQQLGIQTLVFIPIQGGVVEFGSTDLIPENWLFLQLIRFKTSHYGWLN
ncbi:hypothetical protein KI387_002852 [Taxus chinensis]|uniref:LOB domain-containing protein n=1 Tax=Taxus chinensis TaxID=29808 RepID=A0AA38GWG2_TAXCH|nr:hypothetical protein KI387_002852 [Taxus chinensis]